MERDEIVRPAFLSVPPHVSTAGPEAAQLAESAGLVLDLEQRLLLDTLLAEDEHGHWAAFEACVICARQNLKTVALQALALADLFLLDAHLIVWTAHLFDTAQEAFRDLVNLVDGAPHLSRQVKHVHRARGDEGIELVDGRRLNFLARSRTGGRGLSGDRVILDEAFAVSDAEMGSLLPTLSARVNSQVVYASSAGLVSSSVLRGIRDRGRAGGDPSLAYVEWCDPTPGGCIEARCGHQVGMLGCALDDLERVARANPALRRRIPVERVLAERRAMPPLEFARERLGWWDDPPVTAGTAFDVATWLRLADPDAERGRQVVFGVDVDPDRVAHVAVAWLRPDRRVQVQLAASGISALAAPDRLRQLAEQWGGQIVLGGAAGALDAELPKAHTVTSPEFAAACGRLADLLGAGQLRHGNQPELNEAVRTARWRTASEAGVRSLQLRDAPSVGPLAAVVRALHGLLVLPKPPPPKPISEKARRGGERDDMVDLATMEF